MGTRKPVVHSDPKILGGIPAGTLGDVVDYVDFLRNSEAAVLEGR